VLVETENKCAEHTFTSLSYETWLYKETAREHFINIKKYFDAKDAE